MDAHARGLKALADKDYNTAILELTAAIKSSPKAATYYLHRSSAYIRMGSSEAQKALDDAEAALVLATDRASRDLIGKAQLRRAIALFHLKRFKDAEQCLAWAKAINDKDATISIWEVKIKEHLADSPDDQRTIQKDPGISVDTIARNGSGAKTDEVGGIRAIEGAPTSTLDATPAETTPPRPAAVTTQASQIRHDWYQSNDTVTITLLVKGVSKDRAVVDILRGNISVSFPLPNGSDYHFSLDPLYAAIDPATSSYRVLSTKIELTLKKAVPGTKWHSLEGTQAVTGGTSEPAVKPIPQAILQGPMYPTSSRHGPKNWDKLAADLTKRPPERKRPKKPKKPKNEDDVSKVEGVEPEVPMESMEDMALTEVEAAEEEDYVSDTEGGDAVNSFFKKIYQRADPDMQRAMMKSFTESNGTALSTNWDEVKKGKVETSPPEGMEARQWG